MAAEETTERKKSPLFALLKAVACICVLVLVQVVGAAILLPTANETEALAKQLAAAEEGEEVTEPDASGTTITDAQTRTEEEAVEVELGPFSVTRYNPETDATINIDFELFATVLAEEHDEFNTQFASNRNRLREQVIFTLHSADANDLTDPGLGLIKRQILEKSNRALGKPLVREILMTRFNFVER